MTDHDEVQSVGGTFTSEIDGFTPVIDVVADALGLMPALVYGLVWRHCRMKLGVCFASLETLAKKAGVSRKTIERYLKGLCDLGYVRDLDPGVRNRPHRYQVTGKVVIKGSVRAEIVDDVDEGKSQSLTDSKAERPTSRRRGKSQSLTRSVTESHRSVTESDPGKTESPMKIPSYDTNKDRSEDTAPTPTATESADHSTPSPFERRIAQDMDAAACATAAAFWGNRFGDNERALLDDAIDVYGAEEVRDAILYATSMGVYTWRYVESVLEGRRKDRLRVEAEKECLASLDETPEDDESLEPAFVIRKAVTLRPLSEARKVAEKLAEATKCPVSPGLLGRLQLEEHGQNGQMQIHVRAGPALYDLLGPHLRRGQVEQVVREVCRDESLEAIWIR